MSLSLVQAQWLIGFMRRLPGAATATPAPGAYEQAMRAQAEQVAQAAQAAQIAQPTQASPANPEPGASSWWAPGAEGY